MKIRPRGKSSFHLRVITFGLLAGLELPLDGQCAGLGIAVGLSLWFKKAEEWRFLGRYVQALWLHTSGLGGGQLLVEFVDVELEVGEFFFERKTFGEEIGGQFGLIDLDDVGAGFEFAEGV